MKTLTMKLEPKFNLFELQYIETALWSSIDSDGNELDAKYSINDLSPEAIQRVHSDCHAFAIRSDIMNMVKKDTNCTDSDLAHDFWLTRNHHGAGFWDKPEKYTQTYADILTAYAHAFGECHLDVGDDGKLYFY